MQMRKTQKTSYIFIECWKNQQTLHAIACLVVQSDHDLGLEMKILSFLFSGCDDLKVIGSPVNPLQRS